MDDARTPPHTTPTTPTAPTTSELTADSPTGTGGPTLFATFRARDATGLIDYLQDVLGFVLTARYDDGERVAHAELRRPDGRGGVMLGDVQEGAEWSPEPGGAGLYVVADDIDTLYERAVAKDAQVITPLADTPYGSREFAVRDPEGNMWSFGTYAGEQVPAARAPE